MSTGRKAPFSVGDRVTAITKAGATTKVRGTVAKVIEPLDAVIFGECAAVWDFEVDWDDRARDVVTCETCGRAVAAHDATAPALGQETILGRFGRHDYGKCCGEPMSVQSARNRLVSENEIKKLSVVDMLSELGAERPNE